MSSLKVDRWKNATQKDKDIVFGYIHHIIQPLLTSQMYHIIPKEVMTVCLLFYYISIDKWIPNKYFTIEKNSIIKSDSGWYASAYMYNKVSKGIHIWSFRLDKYSCVWDCIGVWKTKFNDCGPINDHFQVGGDKYYGFLYSDGRMVKSKRSGTSGHIYGKQCKDGDVIEMTLDLNKLYLSFKINDKDYGKACDVEKTEYRAAITTNYKDNKITLLSYECLLS